MNQKHSFLLVLFFTASLLNQVRAQLDLDNDGYSDLWELVYGANGLSPAEDADHDGQSNLQESIVGSNPFDEFSYFGLHHFEFNWENSELELQIHVIGGSEYVIESTGSLAGEVDDWSQEITFVASADEFQTHLVVLDAGMQDSKFFRVRQILDADLDGLTSWEEAQLGFDDHDAASSGVIGGGDLSWVVDQLLSGSDVILNSGMTLVGVERTKNEISRFLNQATFGPNAAEIQALELSSQTYGEWLDVQMELPVTTIKASIESETLLGALDNTFLFNRGWWRAAVSGPDQLRQRVAFALSEILVISGQGSDFVRGSSVAAGTYYDLLLNGAFGNYGDILENVTFNVGMGTYLGHLRNQKADPVLGIFPDENYAREIMQLFSIGLWELNRDGSQKLDSLGQPIPTYNNQDITELAKVMTGFNFGGANSFFHYVFTPDLPMTMWPDFHDQGEKFLVNGGYLSAGLQPEEDVRLAVRNLAEHPSTGAFLGRLLIQRLVTSNPSPSYIERVANAYYDNGKGEIGDLKSVVRAIFLDPEARTLQARSRDDFGKMREPYVTYVHLVRAFGASNDLGSYPIATQFASQLLGQNPLSSPTVFNFFSPDYSPVFELEGRGLVAPEFEIMTPSRSVTWPNVIRRGIEQGVGPTSAVDTSGVLLHDFSDELALVNDTEALIDHLNCIFTYGNLSEAGKQVIRDAIADEWGLTDEKKIFAAIYLIMTSPEYVILN